MVSWRSQLTGAARRGWAAVTNPIFKNPQKINKAYEFPWKFQTGFFEFLSPNSKKI
jgi:hypothetical protein